MTTHAGQVKRTKIEYALSALNCLYLEAKEDIADDVNAKVRAALQELVDEKSALAARVEELEKERDEARTVNAATEPQTYWANKYHDAKARTATLLEALEDACLTYSVHGEQPPEKWLQALSTARAGR
jgi:flagellar biosynthesis/type III secretory pathway chaperone